MVVYTLEQRWDILRLYFENHGNDCRMCAKITFGFWEECSLSFEKIKETGILSDKPKREKPKTVRTPENIAAVVESLHEAPQHQFNVVLNN